MKLILLAIVAALTLGCSTQASVADRVNVQHDGRYESSRIAGFVANHAYNCVWGSDSTCILIYVYQEDRP